MNVFVLCTGRCGSVTFAKACRHITNFTAFHESRMGALGPERLAFPDAHIEVDGRLAFFLGGLEEAYGDSAAYVHLVRDPQAVARSFARRYPFGIIGAYANGIVYRGDRNFDVLTIAKDYCRTVNGNIRAFIKNKSKAMVFHIEQAAADWPRFWALVGAEGDQAAAQAEFETNHNATRRSGDGRVLVRGARKCVRVLVGIPHLIKNA